MSWLSSMLGLDQAAYNPANIPIQQPVSTQEAQNAIAGSNTAIGGYSPLLQSGINTGVYGQQQQLADMLMQQSQGQGPNPAQAMFNQNTAQNVQRQAALMGSQRGANVNPALLARQAGMQGSQIQQQAAGQQATLQAQQQLAAQQALMQQQAQMSGQNLGIQNAYTQAAQAHLQTMLGGISSQNAAQLEKGKVESQMNMQQQQAARNAQGGLLNAAGPMLQRALPAIGNGLSDWWAGLGTAGAGAAVGFSGLAAGAGEAIGGAAASEGAGAGAAVLLASNGGKIPGKAEVNGDSEKNDKVHAMLSPGEFVIPRSAMKSKEHAMAFIEQHFNKQAKKVK
jgi:hypothetical protein